MAVPPGSLLLFPLKSGMKAILSARYDGGPRTGAGAGCRHAAGSRAASCLVALFLLSAAGCTLSRLSAQEEEEVAVVVQAGRWVRPEITEAMLLAERQGGRAVSGLPGSAQNQALVDEIEQVLMRVRNRYPAMADVVMREVDRPNSLILELERELFIRVSDMAGKAHGPARLLTGNKEFDRLNAKLGLGAVSSFPLTGSVVFHYDRFLDVEQAVRSYESLDGVISAEPDVLLTDGADIDMLQHDGIWYVVFLNAWGDCPSGCLHRQHHFFIVSETGVDQMEPDVAQEVPEFARLVIYLHRP